MLNTRFGNPLGLFLLLWGFFPRRCWSLERPCKQSWMFSTTVWLRWMLQNSLRKESWNFIPIPIKKKKNKLKLEFLFLKVEVWWDSLDQLTDGHRPGDFCRQGQELKFQFSHPSKQSGHSYELSSRARMMDEVNNRAVWKGQCSCSGRNHFHYKPSKENLKTISNCLDFLQM